MPARLRDERGGGGVGIPALGAEREELRSVREVNDAAGRAVVGFAQQRVAEVFGGDENPIGAPVEDLAAEPLDARGGIGDGEDREAGVRRVGRRLRRRPADDAAFVAGARQVVEPDEIAARGAAARRSVGGVGGEEDAQVRGRPARAAKRARASSSERLSSSRRRSSYSGSDCAISLRSMALASSATVKLPE